jgi:hypothetical protein
LKQFFSPQRGGSLGFYLAVDLHRPSTHRYIYDSSIVGRLRWNSIIFTRAPAFAFWVQALWNFLEGLLHHHTKRGWHKQRGFFDSWTTPARRPPNLVQSFLLGIFSAHSLTYAPLPHPPKGKKRKSRCLLKSSEKFYPMVMDHQKNQNPHGTKVAND